MGSGEEGEVVGGRSAAAPAQAVEHLCAGKAVYKGVEAYSAGMGEDMYGQLLTEAPGERGPRTGISARSGTSFCSSHPLAGSKEAAAVIL